MPQTQFMNRILISFALLVAARAGAQNLVPNGSFEEHTDCPHLPGLPNYAGWLSPWGSADYFNACDTTNYVGVPSSQLGFQYAADGQAYVGMETSAIGGLPWTREIIAAQLLEPLQPGVPICLSFKTAMGGFGTFFGNSTIYSCKGIGLKFFTALPADWQTYLYPNSAAIHLDVVPTDTAVWYSVSGQYVPDSAYNYVAVGNFFADSLIQLTLIDSAGIGGMETAYAFVDDVRASFDLAYCTQEVGIKEEEERVGVYPIPFTDELHLLFPKHIEGTMDYQLLDATGRVAQHGTTEAEMGMGAIKCAGLSSGVYMLQFMRTNGMLAPITLFHTTP